MDVETNIEDSVESDSEDYHFLNNWAHRLKYQLIHLPFNSLDSVNILCFLNSITCPCLLNSELAILNEVGYKENLTQRQLHCRVNKVIAKIMIADST